MAVSAEWVHEKNGTLFLEQLGGAASVSMAARLPKPQPPYEPDPAPVEEPPTSHPPAEYDHSGAVLLKPECCS